jgi:RNA polymerase sigma-70 factor (ECF subfamily)
MDEQQWLADRFEEHRAHLRVVAYRMLGSLAEADDAVQDTWLRLSRSGIVGGRPITLMGFTVAGGKIVEIHVIADPQRVRRLASAVLSG